MTNAKKLNLFKIFLILIPFAFLFVNCNKNTDDKMTDIKYGKHKNQKLDISLPSDITDNHEIPIILCIHGGSWNGGDKSNFDYLKDNINNYGYAYVSINYRLIEDNATFDDMLDDIHSAITFLKKNREKYHLKIDKMGIIGSSAGAHLALLYSYKMQSDIKIAVVSSQVGPSDFCDPSFISEENIWILDAMNKLTGTNLTANQIFNLDFQYPDAWSFSSPIHYVNSNVPPTILAYGMIDELVPYSNATRLDEKLIQFGVPHKLIAFPNSGHSLSNDSEKTNEYYSTLIEYLDIYLPKDI
ncbi:MAG: alpha/beta hydrolase [Bacteroidales bacterium]|jgi:acetyl esterase/lipase|nr:alpha/beta hydrolase [Bacteroidales bacterium]